MCVCVRACMCVYTNAHVHAKDEHDVCMYVCVHARMCVRVQCTSVCNSMCTYMFVCVHISVHGMFTCT